MTTDVRTAVDAVLRAGGADDAIAFGGRWRSWDWIHRVRHQFDEIVAAAALAPGSAVGLVARNRPPHVALIAAQVAGGRLTSMITPVQAAAGLADEIMELSAPIVAGDFDDWGPEALSAAHACGSIAVAIGETDGEVRVEVLTGVTRAAVQGHRRRDPEIAFEVLSSGTTGPPKRVPLSWNTLSSAVSDAATAHVGSDIAAPQIIIHPLFSIGGATYTLPVLANRQRVVLLERFDTSAWVEAVRHYRPARASLPPAAVRMVLDSQATAADLGALQVVVVGGGKLDGELQLEFEGRFGIPILTAYGATEFAGVVANWSLSQYRNFGNAKRGSAGRASANVKLRIVDRATYRPVVTGEIGLLEARVDRVGPRWIRTNDLCSLDEDGFLYVHGRADGAINRGGFKIVPEVIAAALRRHPSVSDAAVVGVPDARLDQVPVAAVELRKKDAGTSEELLEFLRGQLPAYQIPISVYIVDSLPRNPSMKVAVTELRTQIMRLHSAAKAC